MQCSGDSVASRRRSRRPNSCETCISDCPTVGQGRRHSFGQCISGLDNTWHGKELIDVVAIHVMVRVKSLTCGIATHNETTTTVLGMPFSHERS